MAKTSQKWLVKSGSFIYGPFDDDSIKEQLHDKRITVRDEVIGPMKNWLEINDELYFSDTVEQLRIKSINEDLSEFTNTETVSEFKNPLFEEPEVKKTSFDPLPTVDRTSLKNKKPSSQLKDSQNSMSASSSGVDESSSSSKLLTNIILVLSFPVLVFIAYQLMQSSNQNKLDTVAKISEAKEKFSNGHYESVINIINNIGVSNLTEADAVYVLASSYIRKGNYESAISVLKTKYDFNLEFARVNNLLGLAYLYKKDLSLSDKYFNQALSSDESYIPAYINLVSSSLGSSSLLKYIDRLKTKVADIVDTNEYTYIYMLGLIDAYKQSGQNTYLQSVQDIYKKIIFENNIFYKELMFLKFYADYLIGQSPADVLSAEVNVLNYDLESIENHFSQLEVDQRIYNWKQLSTYCYELPDLQNMNYKLIKSFCRYKNKEFQMALQGMAAVSSFSHPIVKALQATYYFQLGDSNKAEKLLEESKQLNNNLAKKYELPLNLKLSYCLLAKNDVCIKKEAMSLRNMNAKSKLASYAMAYYYFLQKEFNKSYQTLNNERDINRNYKPALTLYGKLEEYVQ